MPWAPSYEVQEEDDDLDMSDAESGEQPESKEEEEEKYAAYGDDEEDEPSEPVREQDGDDDLDDIDGSHAPKTSAEKRRAQNEIFREFAAVRAAQITEKEIKESLKDVRDEVLSIQDILAKQENSSRITNPRDYQTELFQRAKDENIIAVLGTGSGKTHIATLLLREILDREVEARAQGVPRKVAFFLVNSINLVFQQSNVLRCGLDHPVEGICGAMGAGLWQRDTWEKYLTKNMVIVCTAEVLWQCLMHSFIGMSGISLLIFDEAHHTKDNHPYARIMKDYYIAEPNVVKRPRIFGMTASPVDANINVTDATKVLEKILHCKIVTVSDDTLIANKINKPTEHVVQYDVLPEGYEAPLYQQLKSRYGDLPGFDKLFRTAKIFSSELGRWASDKYWSFAFSEQESRKREIKHEFRFHKTLKRGKLDQLNEQIARLKEAAQLVQQYDFGVPSPTPEDLSSKVLVLYEWLAEYYRRQGKHRCIVFVEQRQTARLLNLIFSHLGGPHLHCDILVGVSSSSGDFNISLRSQVLTVAKFRKGELNCLFATSVAEEGLDIPQCNLVVRFDLYRTMIGYVQSRGRARHQYSRYLHMVERGNEQHKGAVWNAKSAEAAMKAYCEGLSKDQLLNRIDLELQAEDLFESDLGFPTYTDPESGAKLTYKSSLPVLGHFVSCLPAPSLEVTLQPTYIISHVSSADDLDYNSQGAFQCEVILPECSPITSMVGKPCRRKAFAKCAAAFQLCLELRKKGFLDANLLPTYKKQLPAMRNALLAISEKKKDQYPMRLKPDFWQINYDCIPDRLYLTVFDMESGLDRPHQPLGLLTRAPIPQLPKFPVYLNNDRASNVVSLPLTTPLKTTSENLEQFTTLFQILYEDIFNKVYEHNVPRVPYWQVPIRLDLAGSITSSSIPEDVIDMDQVQQVCTQRECRWTPSTTPDELTDMYFVDRGDGGRRFYSISVEPHLRALDPVPQDAPSYKYCKNILDYSVSLWKTARERAVWDTSQPVVRVEKIPFRRNHLAAVESKEASDIRGHNIAYVCPEPFRISAVSTRFIAMCYVFPAIIHRVEDYLIGLEAAHMLGLNIGPALCLEALTKDSENSDEHGEEKINFKSGMGSNYERLEFMGDCFLKMATSISTFVLQPDENEFEFHVRRMVMLCNKNLFNTAMDLKLVEFVRTQAFSRRTWYPKGLKMLSGKGHKAAGNEVLKHSLGDKSVADVCEAFIGAAFMEHNKPGQWSPEMWDQAVKAVKVLVQSKDHLMEKFSDYYAAYEKPKYQVAEATATQLDLAAKVEKQHPYHFKYPRLVRSAFIHPSQAFMWEHIPNYQRLEFLGDALLDQAFIMYLFYRYPEKDPQWMTEHKMPMVCNKFLGTVCVELGFYHHIRQNNAMLSSQIYDWVNEIEEAKEASQGAVDYWTNVSEPPKCLADVVEAYVAAMFVDSEFNFQVVQDFFDMHLKQFFLDMSLYDDFANHHPVTRLRNLLKINFDCRDWRMAVHTTKSILPGKDQVVAMIMIHNKVRFHGFAVSERYARGKAAHQALERLDGLPEFQYRRDYGCDCEESVDADKKSKEVAKAAEMELAEKLEVKN
ncbi:hypothetical protein CC80DRAFT_474029 [Byssothecium circinans]|uniref:Dicer-like protein 1 n=1 Tax=Byssothecium circinans TaxID=147558 RepID=A0A6A5U4E0_9PLEO|nr:hypothetical protein CC80DRAFT_474029 [Byssothecium circinans]